MSLSAASRDEIESLRWALAARRSFSFHLLVVERGLTFPVVLDALKGVVGERTMVSLHPNGESLFHATAPGTLSALVDRHLDRLDGVGACAIEATEAELDEGERWAGYFLTLNAQRDALGRRLDGPLFIALRPVMEPLFARAASDLWSVRSTRTVLRPDVAARSSLTGLSRLIAPPSIERAMPTVQGILRKVSNKSSSLALGSSRSLQLMMEMTATPDDVREFLTRAPQYGESMYSEVLAALEDRMRHPSTARAEGTRIALIVARDWVRARPAPGATFELVRWLVRTGDLERDEGRFDAARGLYGEALSHCLAMSLEGDLRTAAAHIDPRALIENRLAEVDLRDGDLLGALQHAEVALRLRAQLHNELGGLDTAFALARSHLRVGDLFDRQGHAERAMDHYRGSVVALLREAAVSEIRAFFVGALLRLAASRIRVGAADEDPPALRLATAACERAAAVDDAEWTALFGIALLLNALASEATDPEMSADFARRARSLLRRAFEHDPTDLHVLQASALCDSLIATAEKARAELTATEPEPPAPAPAADAPANLVPAPVASPSQLTPELQRGGDPTT